MKYELKRDDVLSLYRSNCFDGRLAAAVSMRGLSDETYSVFKGLVEDLQGPKDKLELLTEATSESFSVKAGPIGSSNLALKDIFFSMPFFPIPKKLAELCTLLEGPQNCSATMSSRDNPSNPAP